MDVCAVIVSYGDRAVFFTEVIERLAQHNLIKYIVLVNNDIQGQSADKLEELRSNKKIIVVDQGHNSGSAKGFKDGIEKALKLSTDFIWLLDDDNLPKDNALNVLDSIWRDFSVSGKQNFALLSYRPDREIYKKAILMESPSLMLGPENSFLGFHLFDKLKRITLNEKSKPYKITNYGKVSVAPYGGLFFHKSLINIIGLPDTKYFLYGDDYDFSYRITTRGNGIYLVLNSIVDDLEKSFHLKETNNRILSNRLIKTDSKSRIYYFVRNGITFEQNFVSNKAIYIFNAVIHVFLTLLILFANPRHLWKYKYYLKGIKASL
ncbi:glycosyltransferase [Hanstruepera ponticola]|uniref:glycosyltransferase n=1 Tax=Hanstruepera ponticola TaxID=2042995 RepID=UPI000CF01EE2|nr:glycosyltransferase [Hanstruepera ponticola]